ncbi:MAG: hypothetical protein NVS4B8_15000 [Herpetosiphon sp.]
MTGAKICKPAQWYTSMECRPRAGGMTEASGLHHLLIAGKIGIGPDDGFVPLLSSGEEISLAELFD